LLLIAPRKKLRTALNPEGNTMNGKMLSAAFFVAAGWLAMASLAFAQQSPPESAKAKQIEALVNKAAALVESQGKAAFSEFRKKDSEWLSGETYLFAIDRDAIQLFHGVSPDREGKNLGDVKDSYGQLIANELIKATQSTGSGWVDYMATRPGQTQPAKKWSYVKSVTVDGKPALVGAGFYPE
jgi:cytochrome c